MTAPETEMRALAVASVAGPRPVLVTGGCGFIGCNLADSYLGDGEEVIILDNLSRPGVETNLAWLRGRHGDRVRHVHADLRDEGAVARAVGESRAVFHLAAQTAVTTSLEDPVADFDVNARGTLNVLEAARRSGRPLPVILASTNKIYGALESLDLREEADRHVPVDAEVRRFGLSEAAAFDCCTPYGCSKGSPIAMSSTTPNPSAFRPPCCG
ncbi:CDP-paratose 2-epimerase [Methylobrevis pamukkalensis]|uniref:CDP-paratose 2-epimerase n=1 Tax=Methylobrevis pamukkalensis TaxID=1439726 RepID=A0A1E3H1U7_9HYPH|nr:CDP-paratose 2-epimerase [Methylobrevis pamukkalensis]